MNGIAAFYSLIRYTPDVARGEQRNIAVILVDETGAGGEIRAAPLSRVAPRTREQGLLDAVLRSIARRVETGEIRGRRGLETIASLSPGTIEVTPPRPAVVQPDLRQSIGPLYRAFVGVRPSPREPFRKGEILDRVVSTLLASGAPVSRGTYVGDFMIDALIDLPERPAAVQVLSFAVGQSRGITVERDAAHFLYGLERVRMDGNVVLQPPIDAAHRDLWTSHDRVQRWIQDAGIRAIRPSEVDAFAGRYSGSEQLPLSYAIAQ